MLPSVVGVVLSIGVALFARLVGFDRDRAFYPTVLIVVASYLTQFLHSFRFQLIERSFGTCRYSAVSLVYRPG